jgi:hypothetical protein
MVEDLKLSVRTAPLLSMRFEIPEMEAEQRMREIATLQTDPGGEWTEQETHTDSH